MSNEPAVRCPVCRAQQTARDECRRCGADLTLYVQALRSLDRARHEADQANRLGQHELTTRLANYMRWLSP
jgi:hypothetical protein